MMLHLVRLLIGIIATRFKSRSRLEAEIVVLRHQLGILRRQAPKRVALSGRSPDLRFDLSAVPERCRRRHHHSPGHDHSMASLGLPCLLALAITATLGQAEDIVGASPSHP